VSERVVRRHDVALPVARHAVERAREHAEEIGRAIAVVVVDSAGHLVAAERMDGASFVVAELAEEKARTAAAFGVPTSAWRASSRPGERYWGLTSAIGGRLSVLAGGVPLLVDGELVGGLGVSGGDDREDEQCAAHAAACALENAG
jgi:uncharacterized protein GlcG (DUF336 family)